MSKNENFRLVCGEEGPKTVLFRNELTRFDPTANEQEMINESIFDSVAGCYLQTLEKEYENSQFKEDVDPFHIYENLTPEERSRLKDILFIGDEPLKHGLQRFNRRPNIESMCDLDELDRKIVEWQRDMIIELSRDSYDA